MPVLCEHDKILECPVANLCFWRGNTLVFPKGNLLEGVLQQWIQQHVNYCDCVSETVFKSDLGEFDEVACLNSVRGIIPVQSFEGQPTLTSGEKAMRLQQFCSQQLGFLES